MNTKSYTREDSDLFFLFLQQDSSSAIHNIQKPPNLSDEAWNAILFATITVGHENRAVLQTFPEPLSKLASVPWERPEIQHAFIEEKINSRKK